MCRAEIAGDGFYLDAGRRFGSGERGGADEAVGKESLRRADAAQGQRFESIRLEPAPDDEFGRTASDVDYQPRRVRRGQLVRDAQVDQPRLFVAADHVDRRAECSLRLRQELARIACHPEGAGCDGAHRRRMDTGQALAKSRETGKRQPHRGRLDASVAIEAGAEAQRLAPRVLSVDLVALDAPDFQPETVRSEVDDGERLHGQP